MINVSAWSIRNPIPAVMLFVLLCFAGLLSFNAMKVQQFPDIELPTVSVVASLPGAAPAQLETEVARKLENSIASVQGLRHIYTKVQDGGVTITAEFRLEKPVQEAVDDVRSAVSKVRSDLPADLRDPIVNKLDMAAQPVLAFTVRSVARAGSTGTDDEALSWFVDNDVTRRLLAVRGVGGVTRVGGVNREVRVALDPMRLQALGATAADISRQLRQTQQESAGGRVDVGGGEQPIRTLGTVQTAQQLGALQLALSDGRRIRLDQVATVSDTIAEQRSAALLNGQPVVGFEVSRSKGESEVTVGGAVQQALRELKIAHPDIAFTEAFNFVDPVQEEYTGSMHLLYEGAALAVLVVWLFLRNWRATFVSPVALPLSVIPAFAGMYLLGFSVNVITLLALSLVIGILVDDAIVEVENIVRHLRMGKSPYQAAMEAADEIGLAVIATNFTLVAVFLPTAFMSGVAGKFFKQFGWTASLAVVASLVVARVLTPMMSAYMLKPAQGEHKELVWMKIYMRMATWSLKHRFLTMLGATAFFLASIALIALLPTGFIPPDDNSQTQVYLELPPGSTLEQTKRSAERARQLVTGVEHVKSVYTTIGGGTAGADPFAPQGAAEVRKATLTVQLTERGSRPRKQGIENNMRTALEQLPGARSKVGLGVTSAAIGDTLRIATLGDYGVALAKLNLSQRQVPIVVRLQDSARSNLQLLERLAVPGSHGPVMLGQVAALEMTGGPAVIDRYDRARNVNFEIELSGLPLGDVKKAVDQLPAVKQLPPGVKIVEIGDAEVMGELFASFGLAMLTGVLCIYIVLVLLFKDFLHPVTILCALPLALGGAFVGLLVADKSFSMPSLIGLIMLMGIATKNSILLVEYAIVARRDHGLGRLEALLDACHKRARPIVMTTLAMGAGMMPIALGLGVADASFRSPMAIAVIGGLITSTVLSLLVVPAVFTYIDDVGNGWRRLLHWMQRRSPSHSETPPDVGVNAAEAPPARA